jgi:hypothetical protein
MVLGNKAVKWCYLGQMSGEQTRFISWFQATRQLNDAIVGQMAVEQTLV